MKWTWDAMSRVVEESRARLLRELPVALRQAAGEIDREVIARALSHSVQGTLAPELRNQNEVGFLNTVARVTMRGLTSVNRVPATAEYG